VDAAEELFDDTGTDVAKLVCRKVLGSEELLIALGEITFEVRESGNEDALSTDCRGLENAEADEGVACTERCEERTVAKLEAELGRGDTADVGALLTILLLPDDAIRDVRPEDEVARRCDDTSAVLTTDRIDEAGTEVRRGDEQPLLLPWPPRL